MLSLITDWFASFSSLTGLHLYAFSSLLSFFLLSSLSPRNARVDELCSRYPKYLKFALLPSRYLMVSERVSSPNTSASIECFRMEFTISHFRWSAVSYLPGAFWKARVLIESSVQGQSSQCRLPLAFWKARVLSAACHLPLSLQSAVSCFPLASVSLVFIPKCSFPLSLQGCFLCLFFCSLHT